MSGFINSEQSPSRVNIAINVAEQGQVKAKELPFKLLVMRDFSAQQKKSSKTHHQTIPLRANNLDSLLQQLKPQLNLTVKNKSIHLQFQQLSDFSPEGVIRQIPECQRLLAMRHALAELRACAIDNQAFLQKLTQIISNSQAVQQLQDEIDKAAPLR